MQQNITIETVGSIYPHVTRIRVNEDEDGDVENDDRTLDSNGMKANSYLSPRCATLNGLSMRNYRLLHELFATLK